MHFDRVINILSNLDRALLLEWANAITSDVFLGNASLYLCGNGGSMSIASHFETDLLKIAKEYGLVVSIRTLGSNSSLATMISNDYGYENIFAVELEMLGVTNDKLIVISSSGNSPNVVKAIQQAHQMNIESYSLTGFTHSKVEELSSYSINLNLDSGEYAPAEDVHSLVCHAISGYVRSQLARKIP